MHTNIDTHIWIYQVLEEPMVSFLRDFSAPVKLDMLRNDDDLSFLMAHDSGYKPTTLETAHSLVPS